MFQYLERDRRLGVERGFDVVELGTAVEHAELAVRGRVELVGGVGQERVVDAHQVEQTLQFAVVADAEAVEAGKMLILPFGLRSAPFQKILQTRP